MISKYVLNFLTGLSANNNKEWFHGHKNEYQRARKEFEDYVALLIAEIAHFDESVKHVTPKQSIFRINRDIRFSKDKRPYKENFGAFITPGGKNGGYAGYYIHIEPGNPFIAGGIYMPPSEVLKAIRTEIFEDPESFKSIINDPQFKTHFDGLDEMEKLKTAPKGFPKDFGDIGLLNHKHYTASKPLSEEILTSDKLTESVLSAFEAVYPLNRYINSVINEA
jgi:uncharacterized protein (TIGR02453 family)